MIIYAMSVRGEVIDSELVEEKLCGEMRGNGPRRPGKRQVMRCAEECVLAQPNTTTSVPELVQAA